MEVTLPRDFVVVVWDLAPVPVRSFVWVLLNIGPKAGAVVIPFVVIYREDRAVSFVFRACARAVGTHVLEVHIALSINVVRVDARAQASVFGRSRVCWWSIAGFQGTARLNSSSRSKSCHQ